MKGKHHIIIETERLKYEFDIRRNITVIQGESATGKSTLLDIIDDYGRTGRGITMNSDVPCLAYAGSNEQWKLFLSGVQNSIVFIDEDYDFIFKKEFAEHVKQSTNYFVLITRKPLYELPYSINEIYGIRTSGKYHFPEKVYHELYPLYEDALGKDDNSKVLVLVEDSNAGYQFFKDICKHNTCESCGGNSSVYAKLIENCEREMLIIADGAAFGAFVSNVISFRNLNGKVAIYLPESFEWMILKSGVIEDKEIKDILDAPEDYIDSSEYFSWERFFTSLLREKSGDKDYALYSKNKLPDFYKSERNAGKILNVMPEEIRKLLGV